ncbi:MAG: PqqD family protein [Bryobacteraceae bacterium]
MKTTESVRSMVTDDGVVFLDLDKGKVLSSNNVGARIWALIQTGMGTPEIVVQICAEFNVAREIVERDVLEFVASLKERALVEREPG